MYLEENKEINHIFTKHSKEMQERIKNTPEGQSVYKTIQMGGRNLLEMNLAVQLKKIMVV